MPISIAKDAPDSTSSDYDAMWPYWKKVDDILEGSDCIKHNGETYLPRFEGETDTQYKARLALATFTNIYQDIVESLAARPFAEECALSGKPSDKTKAIAEDIDGKGNNMNVFAQSTFYNGINYAIDWILVDYPKVAGAGSLTIADEKKLGVRPYWVRVPATNVLMVVTARIGVREEVVYARILETQKVREGYSETEIIRVRIFERPLIVTVDQETKHETYTYGPAEFKVLEAREGVVGRKKTIGTDKRTNWTEVDAGPITIGVIPMVPFRTGRRKGTTQQLYPPMKSIADKQIDHYQAESNLKSAHAMTCFPMLTGNGVNPQLDPVTKKPVEVPYGPRTILYAPPSQVEGQQPSWAWLEISGSSLTILSGQIDKMEEQMRELGRQPLIAKSSGSLTAATAEAIAQKSNSAVQQWALALKDCLEQAWVFTNMWLNSKEENEVFVFTDFDVGSGDDQGPSNLLSLREKGDLSQRTIWTEFQRRGILSADFDADEEEKAIDEEKPSPEDVNAQRAAMGLPPLPTDPTDPNDPANKVDPNADPNDPNAKKPPAPKAPVPPVQKAA
jgi:hypothetical protein